MSLYGKKIKVNSIPCGVAMRGSKNGEYYLVFEREFASLEDIEAIDWSQPTITGTTLIPKGYGFNMTNISYNSSLKTYQVTIEVADQYLGDVTEYVSQVKELQSTVQEKETKIQELTADNASKDNTIKELESTLEATQAVVASLEVTETSDETTADSADIVSE